MQKGLSVRFLFGLALGFGCGTIRAEEAPPPSPEMPAAPAPPAEALPPAIRLPEIVVTPTRHAADPFQVPYAVASFSGERLQSEQASRQLTDALSEVPGVMVQKTGYGQASPFIRGFTGFRTLLLVDGIRLNNSVFRAGPNQYWATVDPLSIERMELLKGPASALYGSDAVGGTVNALPETRDPALGGGWERRAYLRIASAERSTTERVALSGLPAKALGFTLGYSHKDYGDLRAGSPTGRQENTAYRERDWDGSLVYRFNPDTSLTLVHQEVRQTDAARTHSTIYAQSFHGTFVGGDLLRDLDQSRDLTYLKLRTEDAGSFFETGEFTLSRHVQGEQQDRIQTTSLDVQGFEVATLGASAQFESLNTGIGSLTYGAEFYHDDVSSFRGNFNAAGALQQWRPRGAVADDASYDLYGAYLQDELALTKRWDLTVGTRWTHAEATAHTVADPFDSLASVKNAEAVHKGWDNLSSSVRVLFKATPATHPFAGISQGFRAPNLSDLTQFDDKRSGEINVPSTDLDPEEFLTKELGVKHRDERVVWQAVYYHTEISDFLERTPTGERSGSSPVVKRQNIGNGFVQGVELEGSLRVGEPWTLFANAQWQEGTVDTFVTSDPADKDKRPMSRIAPRSALLGARWDVPSGRKTYLEATAQIVDGQDRISPDDKLDTQRIPPGGSIGYTVFTLRGGMEVRKGILVSLSLENVTDKDYRVLGSGTNSPGRNVVLSVDSRF